MLGIFFFFLLISLEISPVWRTHYIRTYCTMNAIIARFHRLTFIFIPSKKKKERENHTHARIYMYISYIVKILFVLPLPLVRLPRHHPLLQRRPISQIRPRHELAPFESFGSASAYCARHSTLSNYLLHRSKILDYLW